MRPASFGKLSPENGLPLLARRLLLPRLPAKEHLRTKERVLVEGIGNFFRQLKKLEPVRIIGQIVAQGAKLLTLKQIRQQAHNLPAHHLRRKSRCIGHIAQDVAEKLLHHRIRERIVPVGPDAKMRRQLHREPALHPPALHHNYLLGEGRGERLTKHRGKGVNQNFHPVAGIEVKWHK